MWFGIFVFNISLKEQMYIEILFRQGIPDEEDWI
jgi:hypothetical protein